MVAFLSMIAHSPAVYQHFIILTPRHEPCPSESTASLEIS